MINKVFHQEIEALLSFKCSRICFKRLFSVPGINEMSSEKEHRQSPLNIQMLSKNLHQVIFRNKVSDFHNSSIAKSIAHLEHHNLWGKETSIIPDVKLSLPTFYGKKLEEHFTIIGENQCSAYKELLIKLLSAKIPNMPKEWSFSSGWTKYDTHGKAIKVDFPECSSLVFDTEVCVLEGRHPTLACAVSDKFWYSWCSDSLVDETKKVSKITLNDLISMHDKNQKTQPKIIVGHNVSYDRVSVKEQYYIDSPALKFLDTMSLHIATSGLVESQRVILNKNKTADKKMRLPWMAVGCPNSLKDVYKFYCKKDLAKEDRNIFVKGSLEDVRSNFQNLVRYCASDVVATYEILRKLLPLFFDRFPHPVTFTGMLEMGTAYLPVTRNWEKYSTAVEDMYIKFEEDLNSELVRQVEVNLNFLENEKYKNDPWLWNLEWNLPKGRVKKLQGYPNWYRKLCKKKSTREGTPEPDGMSTSLKIVPKLLKLTWNGFPLHHEKEHGWGYLRPFEDLDYEINTTSDTDLNNSNIFPFESLLEHCKLKGILDSPTGSPKEYPPIDIGIPNVRFFRLPHKNGAQNNVGNPLAKDFLKKLEDHTLSSAVPHVAQLVLKTTKAISYWKNNRSRILSQQVIQFDRESLPELITKSDSFDAEGEYGAILPQVVTAGTVTRRAVERTWMTASNAYSDRIGSELKAMVEAPPGYHFVGADVDSQELWIASILGDAYFTGMHGGTAFGWMTLQGNKNEGTDMHSRTAATANISRDNAKIINYGRIYGAGLTFIQTLLRQFNPSLTEEKARVQATKLFTETKGEKGWYLSEEGKKLAEQLDIPSDSPKSFKQLGEMVKLAKKMNYYYRRKELTGNEQIWMGGSESYMFNCLESIAKKEEPRTPVLGCRISRALEPWCVADDFMTSRVNWVVQSSAVDFLHLMLVSMKWLFQEFKINGRFCISIHDEVRYLVASEDRYRAALALHITNLLTRSFISSRLGMNDLPQSVAFFSSVDIDKVLRKEPNMDCVTPSNPKGLTEGYNIPKGESLSIHDAIQRTGGKLDPS